MDMPTTGYAQIGLEEFLEVVLMWHTSGDIPMDRNATTEFIESENFGEFMMSIGHWSRRFGVKPPSKTSIVKSLYSLYLDPARCGT